MTVTWTPCAHLAACQVFNQNGPSAVTPLALELAREAFICQTMSKGMQVRDPANTSRIYFLWEKVRLTSFSKRCAVRAAVLCALCSAGPVVPAGKTYPYMCTTWGWQALYAVPDVLYGVCSD